MASEKKCKVILDDRRARKVATSLGVAVIGTIGILIRAKRNGIIAAVKPVLDDLEATGFFVSKELKGEALRLAGE